MNDKTTRPQMGDEELREILAEALEALGFPYSAARVREGDKSKGICLALAAMTRVRASLPQPTAGSTGEVDPAFGSLIEYLIGRAYLAIDTVDPSAKHRYYYECSLCGGSDMDRDHYKSERAKVVHKPDCLMEQSGAHLKSLASTPAQSVLVEAGNFVRCPRCLQREHPDQCTVMAQQWPDRAGVALVSDAPSQPAPVVAGTDASGCGHDHA